MIEVKFPNSNDVFDQIISSFKVITQIEEESYKDNVIVLNMKNIKYFYPYSALVIGSKIKELIENKFVVKIIPPMSQNVKIAEAIFHIHKDKKEESRNFLENKMERIFEFVKKTLPKNSIESAWYLLAELSDNLDQHSRFTRADFIANYDKEKNHIDIGVLDNGVTIPALFEQKSIKFDKDTEAIMMALRGVSTKEEVGRGRGLETSKELVTNGLKGEFYLFSRRGAVKITIKEIKHLELQNSVLKGTLVYIRFKVPQKSLNIYKYLA